MKIIIEFVKKEFVLFVFLSLLVFVTIFSPFKITTYPFFVDWKIIIALTGLLVITTGLKESGYFYTVSIVILKKLKNEKNISIFFILLSAFMSTFLTNDITLFIVVPLTLNMQNLLKNDLSKLIIFEAIAVNVGSALTPIGNPQNIFLWYKWNISFITFIVKMLPLVIILFIILIIFVWFIFPNKEIKLENFNTPTQKKFLFVLSLIMLIVYLIFLETKQVHLILPIIFIFYFIFYRKILLKTDWLLLILFIVIFIDFHIIANLPIMLKIKKILNLNSDGSIFLFSAFISQLFSNVPASVFVSKFSDNYLAITYGVNVGGNGLVIASLANIIALRMIQNKRVWLDFHKYSLPYFLVTVITTYILFF